MDDMVLFTALSNSLRNYLQPIISETFKCFFEPELVKYQPWLFCIQKTKKTEAPDMH